MSTANLPQLLTLWHNGQTVLTSPGNTGVPSAPTKLGTFPVFEHIPVGTMSGTNPDGSHYNDPGIRWISYFHGGDALHSFNRASFGTPQSLGCVELPLATAANLWPYTPNRNPRHDRKLTRTKRRGYVRAARAHPDAVTPRRRGVRPRPLSAVRSDSLISKHRSITGAGERQRLRHSRAGRRHRRRNRYRGTTGYSCSRGR